MKKDTVIIVAIVLASAFAIGYVTSAAGIFIFILLLGGTAIAFFCSIVALAVGYFRKTVFFKYAGIVFITGALSLVVAYGMNAYTDHKTMEKAAIIINDLKTFKERHGIYPQKLTEASVKTDFPELYYSAESTGLQFSLNYLMDGWHSKYYNSHTKQWIVVD